MTTKSIQIQAETTQLIAEVKVWNWSLVSDAQIQEAMNKIKDWETRKLKIGSDFQEYLAMITRWYPSQISAPGCEYAI